MDGLIKIIAIAADAAGGKPIEIGEVVAATLETIAQIVDRPAINPATGLPITPEEVLVAVAAARGRFETVVETIDQELARLKESPA